MFYVYCLKSKRDNSLYLGYTNDLRRRVKEHNEGLSKYTQAKRPYELVYYEAYRSQKDAKVREENLKKFARAYQLLKKRIKLSLENVSR